MRGASAQQALQCNIERDYMYGPHLCCAHARRAGVMGAAIAARKLPSMHARDGADPLAG